MTQADEKPGLGKGARTDFLKKLGNSFDFEIKKSPMPPTKPKRKTWFWVVGAFVGLVLLSAIINKPSSTAPAGKASNRGSSSSAEHQADPSSEQSSSSAVESLSANWLLAKQSSRHDETMTALTEATQRGDMEAFKRILRVRSTELSQIIDEVNASSDSISDKQKMLVPLQLEKDWADASIAASSQ